MKKDIIRFHLNNTARSLIDHDGEVRMESPGATDFFIDPGGTYRKGNAPFYRVEVEGDFIFRCHLSPEFATTYDAGGILAWETDERWIKFAFEKTDLGSTSLVSVVTGKTSDDCNGEILDAPAVWMQLVRKGDAWAMHYSRDGKAWRMVRYCRLPMKRIISVGLVSQSPIGEGCAVTFTGIELVHGACGDIRKGI